MADPKKSGKSFERLVELLERLSARGASVEFDARIPDRVTGAQRQVDVAVRIPSHHGSLLIAIQCKDYKLNVGVAVVEQEAQKGRDIKADRVLIVTTSGFSADAVAKAAHENIDLLTVQDISSTGWPAWMQARTFTQKNVRYDNVELYVELDDFTGSNPPDLTHVDELGLDAPALIGHDGNVVTIRELMRRICDAERENLFEIAVEGEKRHVRAEPSFDGPVRLYEAGLPGREVRNARVDFEVWAEFVDVPMKLIDYAEYKDDGRSVNKAFVTEPFEIDGQTMRLGLTFSNSGVSVGRVPAE